MQLLTQAEVTAVSGGRDPNIQMDPMYQWAIDVHAAWNSYNMEWKGFEDAWKTMEDWYDNIGRIDWPMPEQGNP